MIFQFAVQYILTSHYFIPVPPETPITQPDQLERRRYVQIYNKICHKLCVIPVSCFETKLMEKDLLLPKRGLGPKGARALAVALVVSRFSKN